MNQILVTEKVIVTPEFKKKKRLYKFNFVISVFLACTLFSCYIYAEYDRNKSEQVSQEILMGLEQEDDTVENNTSVSVDNDVLVVRLADSQNNQGASEVRLSELMPEGNEETTPIAEYTADNGKNYYIEATLRIPCLGIEYPVLSDTSDELLKISLNKLWGPDPNEVGNYVIIGHNYKSRQDVWKIVWNINR